MNDNLRIIAEFVDRASAGMRQAANAVNDYTRNLTDNITAQNRAQNAQQNSNRGASSVTGSLLGVAGQLKGLAAAYLTVTAIIDGFSNAISQADKLDDLSDKTGIAASDLRDLGYAAKIAGSSLDGLLGAMNKLSRATDKADEESSIAARTFDQIGVSTKDAAGNLKSSEQLLYDVADAFKGLEDGPAKTAVAFRLFGGEAKNLLPLLNNGSEKIKALKKESQELANVSPDTFNAFAKAAGDFNDNIDKSAVVTNGFFTTLAADLVPTLNVITNEFIESTKEGGFLRDIMNGLAAVFKSVLVPVIQLTALIIQGLVITVKTLGKSLGLVGAIIVSVMKGDFSTAKTLAGEFTNVFADGEKDISNYINKMALAGHEAAKLTDRTAPAKTAISALGKASKDTKSALEEMVKSLEATVKSGGDEYLKQVIEANQKYAADIKKGLSPAREQQLLKEALALIEQSKALKIAAAEQEAFDAARQTLTDQADATSVLAYEASLIGVQADKRAELIEKFKEEIALRKVVAGLSDADAKNIADQTREANNKASGVRAAANDAKIANEIFDQSLAQLQDGFSQRLQIALKLYEDGKISLQDFTKYQQEAYDNLLKKTEETADKSVVFWQEAAKGIQDSLQSFFFDFMQGKLTNLGDSFKSLIDKMIANALAANLGEALFGGSFEKTGKLGGLAAQGLGFLTSLFGGARANGGPVEAGKAYVVGERRPELFVPDTSGTIIPSVGTQTNGGVTVHMSVTAMDSKSFVGQLQTVKRELATAVKDANRVYNLGM